MKPIRRPHAAGRPVLALLLVALPFVLTGCGFSYAVRGHDHRPPRGGYHHPPSHHDHHGGHRGGRPGGHR